jgi:hypothetical protein
LDHITFLGTTTGIAAALSIPLADLQSASASSNWPLFMLAVYAGSETEHWAQAFIVIRQTSRGRQEETMGLRSTAVAAGLALAAQTGAATAHHSFAMFDTAHPIEISGTVKEFRFVNPHSVLIVTVKGEDGAITDWTLECPAPGIMARQGMTANSLKPGDAFKGTINPLHSGDSGGSYFPPQIDLTNGRPLAVAK